MNTPTPRESHMLALIRRHGPLSRRELHERTGLRPNTVGEIAATMLERGLLREGDSESVGVGRPRQLLEIDPTRLNVVGIAFEHGKVSAAQLNLHGVLIGEIKQRAVDDPESLVAGAAELVRELSSTQTLGIGVSTTGFFDPQTRSILTSSATMRESPTRLDGIYAAAADLPIVVENDMHARATYWLLNQDIGGSDAITRQDILLIDLRDGAIGAALLVGGRPNRGCIIGGNELGHTRFLVETEVCFCGHQGCLERIFATPYLHTLGSNAHENLNDHLLRYQSADAILEQIAGYVAMGIANAINFVRPDRVVIAGQVLVSRLFCGRLVDRVRTLLLRPLSERVRIDLWDKPPTQAAESAAWLALGQSFRVGKTRDFDLHYEDPESKPGPRPKRLDTTGIAARTTI